MLEGFSAVDLTAGGLLGLGVLLVFLGGLIPRWVYTAMREIYDGRLTDAREEVVNWKTAYEAVEERAALQSQQIGELLELGKTMDAFIRSLQVAARRTDNS